MNLTEKNISILLYGSVARNDNDVHSDKDILIVKEDFSERKQIEAEFKKTGWSCSAYTYNRIELLSKKKSLFIQHLKQDSISLIDYQSRVQKIFDTYSPKNNYFNELKEAVDFFKILDVMPDCQEGIGWAFDIIALGFRNFSILKFANLQDYIFSFDKLISKFEENKVLSISEASLLRSSRIYKKLYRERKYLDLPNKELLATTIALLNHRFNLNIKGRIIPTDQYVRYCQSQLSNENGLTAYQKLRLFESYVMSQKHLFKPEDIESIQNMIENPKFYVYSFANKDFVRNLLDKIIMNDTLLINKIGSTSPRYR